MVQSRMATSALRAGERRPGLWSLPLPAACRARKERWSTERNPDYRALKQKSGVARIRAHRVQACPARDRRRGRGQKMRPPCPRTYDSADELRRRRSGQFMRLRRPCRAGCVRSDRGYAAFGIKLRRSAGILRQSGKNSIISMPLMTGTQRLDVGSGRARKSSGLVCLRCSVVNKRAESFIIGCCSHACQPGPLRGRKCRRGLRTCRSTSETCAPKEG